MSWSLHAGAAAATQNTWEPVAPAGLPAGLAPEGALLSGCLRALRGLISHALMMHRHPVLAISTCLCKGSGRRVLVSKLQGVMLKVSLPPAGSTLQNRPLFLYPMQLACSEKHRTCAADSFGVCCAGAAMQVSFSTFEGIAVKLRDSGRFGVVRSIQGPSCTVALGAEDPEKGVVLPEQPETTTAVRRLHTAHPVNLTLLSTRWCIGAQ